MGLCGLGFVLHVLWAAPSVRGGEALPPMALCARRRARRSGGEHRLVMQERGFTNPQMDIRWNCTELSITQG